MKKLDLCGRWEMKRTDWTEAVSASVPGTVYSDLLHAERMPDPYYRCNSDDCKEMMEHDYLYCRDFHVKKEDLEFGKIELCCKGLDTFCRITINGRLLAETDNMHRTWIFDIKDWIHAGQNEITVLIQSPVKYCEARDDALPLRQVDVSNRGFSQIRKAHSMMGWDWAPVMPDGGIWREITVLFYHKLKLNSVFVCQEHTEDGRVFLDVQPELAEGCGCVSYMIEFDNETYTGSTAEKIRFEVKNPRLWYPAGYGEPYLYDFKFRAADQAEKETYTCRIGLRRAELITKKDRYGTSMYFQINGIPVFVKGSNYVTEDSIMARYSKKRTRWLLEQAAATSQNMIRVWGGGIFPDDCFFDLCDELGLLVWQDLMFACAQYPGTEEFYESIALETEDNIKRLRNHASLVLWCGNNECEMFIGEAWQLPQAARDDYLVQYEQVLREVTERCDPTRPYRPSSPTAGGDFQDTNSEAMGDAHYWDVWFKQKPLKDYTKYYFRFLSEFGFQSFPAIESVKKFTEPEDRNIFSRVMECHQKDGAANGYILLCLSREFRYPKDFDSLLYVSQLLQAEAVRVGVEHMRRNRNDFRCMGTIYWQLNDCWPAASWSGIDYYGRWKALHYKAKEFYSDILISALYDDAHTVIEAVTNDCLVPVRKIVYYKIKDRDGGLIKEKYQAVAVEALSSKTVFEIDTSGIDRFHQYIEYGADGQMAGIVLLCPNKHFNYKNPEISYRIEHGEGRTKIRLVSKSVANFVELKANDNTAIFSCNYFAMSPGVEKEILCDTILDEVSVRSIYDTY